MVLYYHNSRVLGDILKRYHPGYITISGFERPNVKTFSLPPVFTDRGEP